jgi:beta-ureidopropionase / N-carbamoyl-L-amino-acid hydrolase
MQAMINEARLWSSLMEMAKIGATEKGGVCRLALTDVDRQARDLFVRWCREAGCTVTVDRMGNIFARRQGRNSSLPPVITGSHIDSQPTGGRFDGIYGVMAALEVVRTLNELGLATEAPVDIVSWTNEEGSRFSPCMLGSGVFAGVFPLTFGHGVRDAEGRTVGEELARIGYRGDRPETGHPVGAYFEVHIEQGPILENERKTIGVVTGAVGQKWFDVIVTGQESHAGPTPMHLRRDALVGAARLVMEVNRIGHAFLPDGRATVGSLRVHPNSRNVIPGQVMHTVDLRHPEAQRLDRMVEEMREALERIGRELRLEVSIAPVADFAPAKFDPGCVSVVRESASALGYSHRDIVSGAGHDAIFLARIAPTAMIFVPCEGGISHNEQESATPSDLAAGCNVLLQAVLDRAGGSERGDGRDPLPRRVA